LVLLVGFLVHLNYQLVKTLGGGEPTITNDNGVDANLHDIDAAAQKKRLISLRSQVSIMKDKVDDLKGMVTEMRAKKGADLRGHSMGSTEEYPRLTCTPETAKKQAARMNKRFVEWWSHSACPDQVWMENIHDIFDTAMKDGGHNTNTPYLVLDIGCNKGYTSADFLDALSPGTDINPSSLVNSIRAVARDMNTKFDRDGGVCNDSNKALNQDRQTKRKMEVHCFEPSPATYKMLIAVRSKLMPNGPGDAKWNIHNKGLHEVNGDMNWHPACASAVGDELCTIVADETEGAISVPVVTVDQFLKDTYPQTGSTMPLVHMLKIDAEGLDPAVLSGSQSLLQQSNAMMIMFEFNPGLSEGKSPHGMWGRGGNPRRTLLEVTANLDQLGYDCYLDTHLPNAKEQREGVPNAPALYRITGDCLIEEPRTRGWANVVCAARKYPNVASLLRHLATMV
jgi:FkbM family methyltransferase